MKKISQLEDRLFNDYLDNKLDTKEREALESKLKTDNDLRDQFDLVREAHEFLKSTTLHHPSKNFTAVVMARLHEYPLRSGLIRNGIFLLLGILILLSIAVTLSVAGVFDNQGMLDLRELVGSGKSFRESLPSVPVDGALLVNSIIVLNLCIALLVFDRTVLKPFFDRRRQAGVS